MQTEEEKGSHWIFKQSSELEILISAAIVFAAVTISGVVPDFLVKLINLNIPNNSPTLAIFALVALFLSALLPISIVTHFILRFYWLSLLGLKSAFGNIKLEKLKFDPYYTKGQDKDRLDKHIQVIDKLASSLFAFSFMTIFIFCFGVIIPIIILITLDQYLVNGLLKETPFYFLGVAVFLLFIFICLLTIFDFLSLGLLKRIRKKWFLKVYSPISRFMNIITFSFFYKDIYYTLVSNVSKKVLIPVLPVYLFLAIFLLNYGYYESRLYSEDLNTYVGANAYTSNYYSDQMDDRTILTTPFISSVIQKDNFLKLSVPLTEGIDDGLVECDSVEAIQERGMHWRKWIQGGYNQRKLPDDFDILKNAENALECFENKVLIKIDSLEMAASFKFSRHKVPDKLILTSYIDIADLSRGEHVLFFEFTHKDYKIEIPFIKD